MSNGDRKLKKLSLKISYLREELYDLEEEFDRRGWQLQRAVIELLSRSGELLKQPQQNKSQSTDGEEDTSSEADAEIPAWQRKLFRKISMKTHPDALLREELSERERIERSKMFQNARSALEKREGGRLLEIAAELDIDIEDAPVDEHIASMERLASDLEDRMSQIKGTAAWVWGEGKQREILDHVARVSGWSGKNPNLIDDILAWVANGFIGGQMTYDLPEPETRRVRNRRKPGERPQKMLRR